MKSLQVAALVLIPLATIVVSGEKGSSRKSDQFEELLRMHEECKSLYEVADLLGNWRRFTRGYNLWTWEPEWHTEKVEPLQAVAKVLKKDFHPKESGLFRNKRKEFEQRFRRLIVEPCNTFTSLTGELQSFIQTDLTAEKYKFLIELCRKLSQKEEIAKVYDEFKKEIKITNEIPIKGRHSL